MINKIKKMGTTLSRTHNYKVSGMRPMLKLLWDGKEPDNQFVQTEGTFDFIKNMFIEQFGDVSFSLRNGEQADTDHGRMYFYDEHGNIQYMHLTIDADSDITVISKRMAYHIVNDCIEMGYRAFAVMMYLPKNKSVTYRVTDMSVSIRTSLINLIIKGK